MIISHDHDDGYGKVWGRGNKDEFPKIVFKEKIITMTA